MPESVRCHAVHCRYPREVPPLPWYRQTFPQMLMAGFLPFSAIYIELYYIFASVWGHKVGCPLLSRPASRLRNAVVAPSAGALVLEGPGSVTLLMTAMQAGGNLPPSF